MDIIKKKSKRNHTVLKKRIIQYFKILKSTLRGIFKNRETIIVANQDCVVHNAKNKKAKFKTESMQSLKKCCCRSLKKHMHGTLK